MLIKTIFKSKALFNTWYFVVLDVCAWSLSGHKWEWSSWTTFCGTKVFGELCWDQWCSMHHGNWCTCTGILFPSVRGGFVIAGQSLRPVIIRKVCMHLSQSKGENFPPLLEPSFYFFLGTLCRICRWRDSFGSLAVATGQWDPANTSPGTRDVLPQQRPGKTCLLTDHL